MNYSARSYARLLRPGTKSVYKAEGLPKTYMMDAVCTMGLRAGLMLKMPRDAPYEIG